MNLNEKVNYFSQELYNRPLLDYYNQTINNLVREGVSEKVIAAYTELRDAYIIERNLRLEELKKNLFV